MEETKTRDSARSVLTRYVDVENINEWQLAEGSLRPTYVYVVGISDRVDLEYVVSPIETHLPKPCSARVSCSKESIRSCVSHSVLGTRYHGWRGSGAAPRCYVL